MLRKYINSETGIKTFVIFFILAGAVFLAYGNSLGNDFVWDDIIMVENNDFIRSWENFPYLFNQTYLNALSQGGSGESSYRPVDTLHYLIDYSLWGLDPFWYHFENVLIHFLGVILLYILLKMITGNERISLWAALIFAVHPATTEAVDVISFREDPQVAVLGLSSMILFIKKDVCSGIMRSLYMLSSVVLFFIALFTKESAACFLLLFMLYDYIFIHKGNFFKIWSNFTDRYAVYFAVLIFYVIVRFFCIVATSGLDPMIYPGGNFYTNILSMITVAAFYVKVLIFPVDLPGLMPMDRIFVIRSFLDPRVLPSVLLIISLLYLAVVSRKRNRIISFGIFWAFITFLPVSNIFPIRNHVAIRYLYLPCAGFSIAVAAFLSGLVEKRNKYARPGFVNLFLAVMISVYIFLTVSANYNWKNYHVFLSRAVKKFPDFIKVRYVLGKSFEKQGHIDNAVKEYETIVMLTPEDTRAYMHLGMCYVKKGKTASNKKTKDMYFHKAIRYFRHILEYDPVNAKAFNNIGVCYALLGEYGKAAPMWKKALEINPRYVEPSENLARLKDENIM